MNIFNEFHLLNSFRKMFPCFVLQFGFAISLASNGFAQNTDWVEILKDAQTTSKSKTTEGTCECTVEYHTNNQATITSTTKTRISAYVAWKDTSYYIKYRASGPGAKLIGFYTVEPNHSEIIQSSKGTVGIYKENSSQLQIFSDTKMKIPEILLLQPSSTWYSCCVPNAVNARTWIEMVDLQPPIGMGSFTYETVRSKDGNIKRIRRDSQGGINTVFYSLNLGGNPVRMTFTNKTIDSKLDMEWERINDDIIVLKSLSTTEIVSGRLQTDYTIKYSNYTIGQGVTGKLFDLDALIASIPKNTKVIDHRTGGLASTKQSDVLSTEVLNLLVEKARYKGFLSTNDLNNKDRNQ